MLVVPTSQPPVCRLKVGDEAMMEHAYARVIAKCNLCKLELPGPESSGAGLSDRDGIHTSVMHSLSQMVATNRL